MSQQGSETDAKEDCTPEKISSEDLAALVVDALIEAGIVSEAAMERAVAIAAEEIEVRKVLGDY